jgi:hypothetical protein
VTGGWRQQHNEELHDLYSSPIITKMIRSKRMRWDGHVTQSGEKRAAYKLLVGNPEGKRPLRRQRCRGVDNNIKLDLQQRRWSGVVWCGLAWLRIGASGGLLQMW